MLHLFWCKSVKQAAAASHKINLSARACLKPSEAAGDRCPTKWPFHNLGEINFWLKSMENTIEDVHLYLSCMVLSWNFTKKGITFFSIF